MTERTPGLLTLWAVVFVLLAVLFSCCTDDSVSNVQHTDLKRESSHDPHSFVSLSSQLAALEDDGETVLEPGDALAVLDLSTGTLVATVNVEVLKTPSRPGSVFKLITAAAMLESGLEDTGFLCQGEATIAGRKFACWNKAGHGQMHLGKGLALSCNLYFYDLAHRLDPAVFLSTLTRFGFDRATGFAAGELPRPLPSSLARAEMIDAGVGECDRILPTGLQLLKLAAVLSGVGPLAITGQATDEIIRQAMRDAVELGTAGPNRTGVPYAAKTGTSRRFERWRYHGWCIGFVPALEPEYAFVIYRAQGVGSQAAGIAQRLVASLYPLAANREARP